MTEANADVVAVFNDIGQRVVGSDFQMNIGIVKGETAESVP